MTKNTATNNGPLNPCVYTHPITKSSKQEKWIEVVRQSISSGTFSLIDQCKISDNKFVTFEQRNGKDLLVKVWEIDIKHTLNLLQELEPIIFPGRIDVHETLFSDNLCIFFQQRGIEILVLENNTTLKHLFSFRKYPILDVYKMKGNRLLLSSDQNEISVLSWEGNICKEERIGYLFGRTKPLSDSCFAIITFGELRIFKDTGVDFIEIQRIENRDIESDEFITSMSNGGSSDYFITRSATMSHFNLLKIPVAPVPLDSLDVFSVWHKKDGKYVLHEKLGKLKGLRSNHWWDFMYEIEPKVFVVLGGPDYHLVITGEKSVYVPSKEVWVGGPRLYIEPNTQNSGRGSIQSFCGNYYRTIERGNSGFKSLLNIWNFEGRNFHHVHSIEFTEKIENALPFSNNRFVLFTKDGEAITFKENTEMLLD